MLNPSIIQDVLNAAMSTGGDFAEVFIEDKRTNSFSLIGKELDKAMTGRDFGVGIRILQGTQAVYGYTNDVRPENLIRTAKFIAKAFSGTTGALAARDLTSFQIENRHLIRQYPQDIERTRKLEIMRNAYDAAKGYHSSISQARINFLDWDQQVCIANTEGLLVEDRRVLTRLMIEAVASKNGERQSGFYGPGAMQGLEFYDEIDVRHYAQEAARTAVTMVEADYAPSGKYPVIIDNEFGGVIFHEACGHSLEATAVAKNASEFAGKLGEQVASELVSAYDDGTILNAWGSAHIDDEGSPTRRNLLIENGILKGYLIDKLGSRKMGMPSTGSGRRESYKFAPTSRMTNTYIAAGQSKPEDIIADTEYGLYAKYMGGGSVNPATGAFNFAVREAYIVRNGKIAEPVRGATLIGTGIEVLRKIDRVGTNLAHGQGMCGSQSGSIPANVGQPMIRVSSLTVGGRKERS